MYKSKIDPVKVLTSVAFIVQLPTVDNFRKETTFFETRFLNEKEIYVSFIFIKIVTYLKIL